MKVNILLILLVLFMCLGCEEKEETHEIGENCKDTECICKFCNSDHTSVVTCDKETKKYVEFKNCAASEGECFDHWGEGICTKD